MILLMMLFAVSGEPAAAPAEPEPLALEANEFDPAAWDRVVSAHVRAGILDYAAVTPEEIAALDTFLEAAGGYKLTSTFGKEPRTAFLINVYNAWAARQILAHPRAVSLADIPGFFDGNAVRVAGEERTLNDIEALLPTVFREQPVVMFCLSPGGTGYPLLPARAYTGATLMGLAQDCMVEYFKRPQFGKQEESGELVLPAIIDRHQTWFERTERGLLGVIGPQLPVSTVIALSDPDAVVTYPEPAGRIPGRGENEPPKQAGDPEGSGW